MRILTATFLLMAAFTCALCQKLPNVQQVSLRAPANVRVDGNLNEWNNQLQALNPIDGVAYTISNNNENIYLTLLAPYGEISKKAVRGGITFSVSKLTDKRRKTDEALQSVTFPISKYSELSQIFGHFGTISKIKTKSGRDSVALLATQAANKIFKTIKINSQTISIYNDENIVVAVKFNSKLDIIYELSVPLRFLRLDIDHPQPFSYNIRLNGKGIDDLMGEYIPTAAHPNPPAVPIPKPGVLQPPLDPNYAATDFWGEYTLAK